MLIFNTGQPFLDKFSRDICVNFILAGRDTSLVALSWFSWLLHHNPRVEERILEEICGIVSEREEVKKGGYQSVIFRPKEIKWPFALSWNPRLRFSPRFPLFFFFSSPQLLTLSTVNSAYVYCSRSHKLHFLAIFFIKNGSHNTIYTFKNYFATVFSVSVFSFSKNKLNPNTPIMSDGFRFLEK